MNGDRSNKFQISVVYSENGVYERSRTLLSLKDCVIYSQLVSHLLVFASYCHFCRFFEFN